MHLSEAREKELYLTPPRPSGKKPDDAGYCSLCGSESPLPGGQGAQAPLGTFRSLL